MKENGDKEVLVKIADGLSEQQKKEFVIKDNSGFGSWDFEMLANDFGELPLEDWGLNLPGVEEKEKKDLSENFNSVFNIEIIFENAEDQEKAYNKLKKMGYVCKILTL
jgi:hypothetical protein